MRRTRAQDDDHGADAGFAAADGLIAVTLSAMLLAVVVNSAAMGLKTSRAGWDRRLAVADAEYRLAAAWPGLARAGRVGGLEGAWGVSARPLLTADEGPGVCQVRAEVAAKGGALGARLETVRFCRAAGS